MLVDENGNPEPNNRQTARCVECGQRKQVELMHRAVYKMSEEIQAVAYYCDIKVCVDQNKSGEPNRIINLRRKHGT